jgi:succinate-acetate transporter protein
LGIVYRRHVDWRLPLAYADFTGAGTEFKHATGFEGIICGLAAIYTGLAQILNELYGRTLWPLGLVKK